MPQTGPTDLTGATGGTAAGTGPTDRPEAVAPPMAGDRANPVPPHGPLPTELGVTEPGADEPLAVVAAGPAGAGRREVLAALLEVEPGLLVVPSGSYLVLTEGRLATRSAFVPGYRQSLSYGADPVAAGPALARPPRRVELRLPLPLLRHFTLVDTPDTGSLGLAGGRVLLDAVGRGGALIFVISADQVPDAAELELLGAAVRAGVAVFPVITAGTTAEPTSTGAASSTRTRPVKPVRIPVAPARPTRRAGPRARSDRSGPSRCDPAGPSRSDPAGSARSDPAEPARSDPAVARSGPGASAGVDPVPVGDYRAALLAAVPELAGVPWFHFQPEDPGQLRRTLVDWAADEGLRRASASPPGQPGGIRRVPVAAGVGDWAGRLDRQTRDLLRQIRQNVSLELAAIHLRAVRSILSGAGVAGLPALLDHELHALSLIGTRQCDLAVRQMLADGCAGVFGAPPGPEPDHVPPYRHHPDSGDGSLQHRVAEAVRWGLADPDRDPEFDRVFLVTSTAGLATLVGAGGAHPGYPGAARVEVLPPLAVALAGGCYQHWRHPSNDDPGAARSWVQRAVREVELELLRELTHRFEAVRRVLKLVLSDALERGFLLV